VRQLLDLQQAGALSVLVISAAIVSVVALFAAMTPVSRALAIDPMEALRSE
jgi:ABC-type antimicrobial peptide transport system permease subunit